MKEKKIKKSWCSYINDRLRNCISHSCSREFKRHILFGKPSTSTPTYLPNRNKNICSYKDFKNAHSCSKCRKQLSQLEKMTQTSMYKEKILHNGILTERMIYCYMHHVEWKTSDTKDYIPYAPFIWRSKISGTIVREISKVLLQ